MVEEYLNIFIDQEYPKFIDKYLETKTLTRLKEIGQFCGCDYTKIYSPLFFYSRYLHSLVVAHMTYHFTHNKKATIAALLHDVGTPCFAHTIDYVLGDYQKQESSEKEITFLIKQDKELVEYLKEDGIELEMLKDLTKFPILENESPKLCTDRLDGVLHTVGVWLHTHSFHEIKEVYDNLVVLKNEDNCLEIGFQNKNICCKFVNMVLVYAKELQDNEDKFVMKYISEIIKKAITEKLFTLEDLYNKNEQEIITILEKNYDSWKIFKSTKKIKRSETKPLNNFNVSVDVKRRNVIPLLQIDNETKRINEWSDEIREQYDEFDNYQDTKYAYVEEIKNI